jgi:hypothetical protein
VSLPTGTPETKVIVYFTDGQMNTIQDYLPCINSATVGAGLFRFSVQRHSDSVSASHNSSQHSPRTRVHVAM